MNKNAVINEGNMTDAANFSGYDQQGQRIHVYGRQLTNVPTDWFQKATVPAKDAEGKLIPGKTKEVIQLVPGKELFVIANYEEQPDGFNKPRPTCKKLFTSQAELVKSYLTIAKVNTTILSDVQQQAIDAKLDSEAVAKIVASVNF